MFQATPPRLLAVILAGGEGRRMGGVDKGLQCVAGQPLVARVHACIASQVAEVVISANRNINAYASLAPVLQDREPGYRGPLAGIAMALEAAADRWLLSVPVDCPAPPSKLAGRLTAALADHDDARCVVAFDGERGQPLFALYRHGLADAARQALRDNVAVWRWQREIGCVQVDFADCADAFRNLNTDADLRSME